MGINQAICEAKGCCWKPTNLESNLGGGTPWCFFPAGSNPCENITWDGNDGMGFDQPFYDKMYQFFDANINIQGQGGVVAAPDPNTPGGSYYYHWMRDAALTMRTYM
jgi:glucoamylase